MTGVAAQPASAEARRIPGEVGVWLFVFGDMLIFAVLFGIFLYYRGLEPAVFAESQATLNQFYGALNVFVLLTSSWFVASAVEGLRRGDVRLARRLLLGALACGALFALIKILEYGEKMSAGLGVEANNFFLYYYMLTGIHFLHVIIGMFVLAYLIFRTRAFNPSAPGVQHFESGGIYWHMVDLLWMVLFPLIYLVR